MQSSSATPANPEHDAKDHSALTGFFDKFCATLARLIAYLGALLLLGIIGLHYWDELPAAPVEPADRPGWSLASRPLPAFAVSLPNINEKSDTYEIFRHPAGGRKDVFQWGRQGQRPVAELEIYRPAGEFSLAQTPEPEIATRMDPKGGRELELAGVVDSKFGTVALLRVSASPDGSKACLAFLKRIDDPFLQISGWSCQGGGLLARRAAIGCMLNRLTLLAAGNEPKLTEFFARAELKDNSCGVAAASAPSSDSVTGTENPRLRGPL